jgi:hypothetical protein
MYNDVINILKEMELEPEKPDELNVGNELLNKPHPKID